MRKVLILLALLIWGFPIFAQGLIVSLTDDHDTLAKYNYPILLGNTKHGEDLLKKDYSGNATGFFVRQDGHLLLCTAYHVVMGCDVYAGAFKDDQDDQIAVIYPDSKGILNVQVIPFPNLPPLSCLMFWQMPDFVALDVSDIIKNDELINSVEGFFREKFDDRILIPTDTILCYGFPGRKWIKEVDPTLDTLPRFSYHGKIVKSDTLIKKLLVNGADSFYFLTSPAIHKGASGAPIFRVMEGIGKVPYVVLEGVQSGENTKFNLSTIVSIKEIMKIFKPDHLK